MIDGLTFRGVLHEGACHVSFSGGYLKDESDIRLVWMGTTCNPIRPAAACMIVRALSEVTHPSAADVGCVIMCAAGCDPERDRSVCEGWRIRQVRLPFTCALDEQSGW
ncbi:MAG TPA: hypothetical protein ENF23_02320 [Methanosarcinales archaeon]|nr:MAG: hypothetical protein DRO03_11560 [Methanosarcinales archaeon]HDN65122.1 hypothetical protein [Methanosarcinales archaeon]